jgi:hypothetical protein
VVTPAIVALILHLEELIPLEVLWLPLKGPMEELGIILLKIGKLILTHRREGESEINSGLC